ncbi:hypothetical protein [Streptomyces mirabilis]|uniref:hypothetical protein n=1 Tax=Streptomyces mirabilis TaxID=68239 RepID=UPI0036C6B591
MDLVVDATGRSSRALFWLVELGYAETPETVIDAGIAYATRTFRIPANAPYDWKAVYVQLGAPDQTRGGIIAPVEGSRWLVTLGRTPPPCGLVTAIRRCRTPSSESPT